MINNKTRNRKNRPCFQYDNLPAVFHFQYSLGIAVTLVSLLHALVTFTLPPPDADFAPVALTCSGKADNVSFSFLDIGANPDPRVLSLKASTKAILQAQ